MSNRTKKSCVYRDCDTDNIAHPDRTLFQFPKDQERAAKWCKLGAVDPVLDNRPRFMCDRHFSRIYMCFSARRKMLLNTALPFPYGSTEEEEHELVEEQEVQSSSQEEEGLTIERLDEDIDYEGMETEIIYMEGEDDVEDQPAEQPQPSPLKRPAAAAALAVPIQKKKMIRLDKLPTLSTVVSSSSSTTAAVPAPSPAAISIDESLKPITPPKGTVLRKVKLKKRPNLVQPPPIAYQTQTIIIKAIQESSEDEPDPKPAEEPSSPEKKVLKIQSNLPPVVAEKPRQEISTKPEKPVPSEAASSTDSTTAGKTADVKPVPEKEPTCSESSSSTTTTTTNSAADSKKDESIYEFIFKGEEYVQLPKAMWEGQRKDLQQQLDQCLEERQRLERKVERYRTAMKDLQKFMTDVCENEDDA